MYPTDILAFIGEGNDLGRALKQYPPNVQMKYLVTARVFAALMFEPTSGLWKELMERTEGKVTTPLDVNNKGEIITKVLIEYVNSDNTDTETTQSTEAD